ncbi:Potassium channel subfamily K member 18 [Eumeta japonica]|uniref:Potassium channel subfamily K member 18 n=1 Tax=Eumeta variegata TaxID=151549 RepID=A0A4C1UEP8_EUMVA|nr:Potassium channel subfamily K member 18 [Eumeta japonica]
MAAPPLNGSQEKKGRAQLKFPLIKLMTEEMTPCDDSGLRKRVAGTSTSWKFAYEKHGTKKNSCTLAPSEVKHSTEYSVVDDIANMDIEHAVLNKETISRFEQYTLAKPSLNGGVALERCQDGDSVTSAGRKRAHNPRQKAVCCFCFKTTKYRRKQFIIGSLTNLAIFAVLLAYTFLGSFVFLAIEGGVEIPTRPRILPDKQKLSNRDENNTKRDQDNDYDYGNANLTFSANYFWDARSRAVENIWEITVSLNILYRENWTRLAAQEILKFQNELVSRVTSEMASQYGGGYREMALGEFAGDVNAHYEEHEWNLALAFFYSLTVLTTIGYGSIGPRTMLGKGITVLYALFGIPLTLVYLSSVGSLLSQLARSVFSRALCCCLCSNCGYCCYDERRMAEKERRMKLKRQQEEMQNSQNTSKTPTEECYVLKPDSNKDSISDRPTTSTAKDDIISWPDTDSKLSMHGLSILAPVLLCLAAIFIYITIGALVLFKIDNMNLVDGFYFCFMALSTIGFGNIVPGMTYITVNGTRYYSVTSTTLWFCSAYTLTGWL